MCRLSPPKQLDQCSNVIIKSRSKDKFIMMSFPCPLCPCPKSKLLVFYSNFFSAIHTRTVELKPREDTHTGTEGKDLTRMVEACHLWGSLVTECPSHWSRGSRKGKSQMNDMPLVRAGPRHGLNERLLVSSLRKGGSVVDPHGNGGTARARLSGPRTI